MYIKCNGKKRSRLHRKQKDCGGCEKASAFIKMDTAIILTSFDLMANLMSTVSLIAVLSGVVSQATK